MIVIEYTKEGVIIVTTIPKKRIQVQVDENLAREAEEVLAAVGLNSTTAITAFYKRIVSFGGIPFSIELSEREKANRRLLQATKTLPAKRLNTDEEIEAWLSEDEY